MPDTDKTRSTPGAPAGDDRQSAPSDTYYQPWLRNQPGVAGPAAEASAAGPDISRPPPLPTRKRATDAPPPVAPARPTSNLSADELLARPIIIPSDAEPSPPSLGERAQALTGKIGAWTGEAIERAELGDRARAAAARSKKAVKRGAQASAAALRVAAKGAADAASRTSASAAPHVRNVAAKVRQGIAAGAQATAAAAGNGGRKLAGSARSLADKTPAGMLIPTRHDPPASQLDELIAAEDAAKAGADTNPAAAAGRADGLPLFTPTAAPPTAPAAPSIAAAGGEATAPSVDAGDAPVSPVSAHAPAAAAPVDKPARPQLAAPVTAAGPGNQRVSGGGRAGGGDTGAWLRHPASWVAGGVALLFSGFIAGMMWDGGSNRAVTERIVHDYILNNPQIIPQAMEKLQADRVAATINDQRGAIETPFSGAWAGAADGDVTMVVFTDYACTFCRASVADIDRLLREDRRLKVVFRELPILSADSEAAARLALSAARSGRYMSVHRALFASGSPDASARTTVASQFSIPADPARLADPAITREMRNNLQMARDLGFDGTPSWVIGDRAMTGAVGYETLKAAIAAARSAD